MLPQLAARETHIKIGLQRPTLVFKGYFTFASALLSLATNWIVLGRRKLLCAGTAAYLPCVVATEGELLAVVVHKDAVFDPDKRLCPCRREAVITL